MKPLSVEDGTAMELVQQERLRQIEAEGWSLEHDDLHRVGQMADAASCYAKVAAMNSYPGPTPLDEPSNWPWDEEWWKPSSDPIRNLVKAGALIVAEIERLQRKGNTKGVEDGLTDERAVRQVYPDAECMTEELEANGVASIIVTTHSRWTRKEPEAWADARAKLPAAVPVAEPSAPPTLPVPERTAEMVELMVKMRAGAEAVIAWKEIKETTSLAPLFDFAELNTPENILKLLDHIEGKG